MILSIHGDPAVEGYPMGAQERFIDAASLAAKPPSALKPNTSYKVLDAGNSSALIAKLPKFYPDANSFGDRDLTTPTESRWPCQACALCLSGGSCIVKDTDRAPTLDREESASTIVHAPSFPSLAPLAAYERKFGHHAAEVCFIESVWTLLEEAPSNAIPTQGPAS